MLHLIM